MFTEQHTMKQLLQEQTTFWKTLFKEVSLLQNYHTNLTELNSSFLNAVLTIS